MTKTSTPLMLNMVAALVVGLCPVSLAAQSVEPPKESPERSSSDRSVHDAIVAGRNLTPEQVASLEAKLAMDPGDVAVRTQLLAYYGGFFRFGDRRTSIGMLERAQSLDPSNPEWPRKLGHLRRLGALGPEGGGLRIAEKALEHFQEAYALADDSLRDSLLSDLAKTAFSADQLDRARHYAELMLQTTGAGWNSGNRVHHGNLVLGRIALRAGNIEEARSRLIAAGNTTGSPQLNSFGPNMSLAKDLLEIGEREVVLEYFELCSRFWDSDRAEDTLDRWGVQAVAGRIPDFGANLYY